MRLQTQRTVAEITRVASDSSTHGTAGACITALASVAILLGYRRVVSYTLLGERGEGGGRVSKGVLKNRTNRRNKHLKFLTADRRFSGVRAMEPDEPERRP